MTNKQTLSRQPCNVCAHSMHFILGDPKDYFGKIMPLFIIILLVPAEPYPHQNSYAPLTPENLSHHYWNWTLAGALLVAPTSHVIEPVKLLPHIIQSFPGPQMPTHLVIMLHYSLAEAPGCHLLIYHLGLVTFSIPSGTSRMLHWLHRAFSL